MLSDFPLFIFITTGCCIHNKKIIEKYFQKLKRAKKFVHKKDLKAEKVFVWLSVCDLAHKIFNCDL